MIQINLLPHRQIKRERRQSLFMTLTFVAVGIGVIATLFGHIVLKNRYDNQMARNQLLNEEIAGLDKKIAKIRQLREETEALLARKEVVERLQSSRTETVHMLDEIVHQMPDGVHLKTLRQSGTKVTLEGYAQSNARVSTLMENLERSSWFAGPELLESRQVTANNQRVHEFSLDVQIKYDPSQDKGHAEAPSPVGLQSPASGQLPASGLVAPSGGQPHAAGAMSGSAPVALPPPDAPPAGMSPNAAIQKVAGLPKPVSVGQVVSKTISAGAVRSQP